MCECGRANIMSCVRVAVRVLTHKDRETSLSLLKNGFVHNETSLSLLKSELMTWQKQTWRERDWTLEPTCVIFFLSFIKRINLYNTIQYNTIQYNTIQYNTIQYNTIQRFNTEVHWTYLRHLLLVVHEARQSKVSHLDIEARVNEQIVALQVAVQNHGVALVMLGKKRKGKER